MSDRAIILSAFELGLAVALLVLFARAALRRIVEKLNPPS